MQFQDTAETAANWRSTKECLKKRVDTGSPSIILKMTVFIGFQTSALDQYSTGTGSRLRHKYHVATERHGRQRSPKSARTCRGGRTPAK